MSSREWGRMGPGGVRCLGVGNGEDVMMEWNKGQGRGGGGK